MEIQLTQAEKLEALVRKAIEGGWMMFGHREFATNPPWFITAAGQMPTPKVVESWVPKDSLLICGIDDYYFVWEKIIYDHDFARALFGEQGFGGEFTGKYPNPHLDKHGGAQRGWQRHLQQTVISDDPIDSMYRAVFGDE